jgi:aspartyl/asparaginyl beta-hydroxylase (cupin superfamily)
MQLTNDEAMRLVRQGAEALQQGRTAEARRDLERVTQTGRANGQIWGLLAMACRAEGDAAAEEAALDALLALEPRAMRALIMKGDCRGKAGDDKGALQFYETALNLARTDQVPEGLAPELRRAEAAVAEWTGRIDSAREATLAKRGLPPEQRTARFQESIDILAGRKRIFHQEPTGYYFPGLPQIQVFDTAQFDWVPRIEAATDAIRDELAALLAGTREGFRPYLQADPNRPRVSGNAMLDSPDWSALFLCENGKRDEAAIAECPRTWEAVEAAASLASAHLPTVMFSLLAPGARIIAHTGMYNTRLVCHLPLIVPPDCRFRVGNEVREWEVGKLLIFDDTIEHEAWNDSSRERMVLIFDIWRPELSDRERDEVRALLSGPEPG